MKSKISPWTASIVAAIAFIALTAKADDSTNVAANVQNAATTPVTVTNTIKLKFVRVDSEETAGENGSGTNAVDGNPNTFWHTQWQDATPECPHEIIVELVPPSTIKGFTQLPRQDDNDHGNIKDYEFYVSDYDTDFGQPVKKGAFEAGPEKKTVTFTPVKCRFIKLKALSEINGEAWTSIAKLTVIPAD